MRYQFEPWPGLNWAKNMSINPKSLRNNQATILLTPSLGLGLEKPKPFLDLFSHFKGKSTIGFATFYKGVLVDAGA